MNRLLLGFSVVIGLLLAACAGVDAGVEGPPVVVPVTVQVFAPEPTAGPPPAPTDVPQQPQLSFEAATYHNESAGFEFDYPASWTGDEEVFGDRGSGIQFSSSGEFVLLAMVTLWDPKNDLNAFVEQRKIGWSASETTIITEQEMTLAGDRRAASFIVEGLDGEPAYFMFTTLGDRYLVMSGPADLDLLPEVAGTVRPLGSGS